jgi:hypothetical protein
VISQKRRRDKIGAEVTFKEILLTKIPKVKMDKARHNPT